LQPSEFHYHYIHLVKPSPLFEINSLFRTSTRERWDLVTPLAIVLLSIISITFIYSAQSSSISNASTSNYSALETVRHFYYLKQLIFLVLGAGAYIAVALVDYRRWLGIAQWIYFICVIPLFLVLIIGTKTYGSQRWLGIGPFSFQPSETINVAVLLITASILIRSKIGTLSQSVKILGKLALAVGLPMLLILMQPDIKSAIVLTPMVFSMLYVSRLSPRFFAAALGAFLIFLGIIAYDIWRYSAYMDRLQVEYEAVHGQSHDSVYVRAKGSYERHSWVPLHDYQRNRILSFVNPDKIDPVGIGWNQRQSLISVGSGGLLGKGWTQGTQARLGYLPHSVAHNDFIFSVIAEEKGFLGSITVISLFGLVLFNGIRIAGLAKDRLGTLIAIGVTVLFTVHVFVNIAMTIGLLPITGIPLPFISYGGSFVLSCCIMQGLVQSVYRFRKDFQ
jgi:rod shape determining protein RodA